MNYCQRRRTVALVILKWRATATGTYILSYAKDLCMFLLPCTFSSEKYILYITRKYANACLFKKQRHGHSSRAHLEFIYQSDRKIIKLYLITIARLTQERLTRHCFKIAE